MDKLNDYDKYHDNLIHFLRRSSCVDDTIKKVVLEEIEKTK